MAHGDDRLRTERMPMGMCPVIGFAMLAIPTLLAGFLAKRLRNVR